MRISDWSSDVCSSDLPGKHGVLLRHDGINRGAGGFMTFAINAGDIQIFWVGVTGNGWGVLTIDNFDSESEARACVQGAEYSVKPATDGGGPKTEPTQRLEWGIVRLQPGIFLPKPGRHAKPSKTQPA